MKYKQFTWLTTDFVTMPRWNITFWDFELLMWQNFQTPASPTFEINGHGAFVSFRYRVIHIIWWNINNLPHWQPILLQCRGETSLFGILSFSCCKTVKNQSAPTFEINGHGAFVSCHYSVIHITWWNINNLPHWQPILLQCRGDTSLLGFLCFSWCKTVKPPLPYFWNKWSWGFCVMPLELYTHNMMKYKQSTSQTTDLVTMPLWHITFGVFYAFHVAKLSNLRCPTFEINGHGVSVSCH